MFTRGKTVRSARGRSKGQAVVETALAGLLLGMLLAAAIDFGRAYYTAVVVTNMAGEGAAYAALFPDRDLTLPTAGACARLPVEANQNIQDRARRVARERGLVIDAADQNAAVITITPTCVNRCAGDRITVQVSYRLNDLFIPGLLGMDNILITRSASQQMAVNAYRADQLGNCPP